MKQQKIYMKTWLDSHSRLKLVDTDQWYLDLANHLLWVISESDLYREETLEASTMTVLQEESCKCISRP